jgi:hypothetical protein
MKFGSYKTLLLSAIILLILSISLSLTSLYSNSTDDIQSKNIINNSFRLSQNETYRQGLGAFHGGENITITVQCPTTFMKNFSIITYNGPIYVNSSKQNILHTFTADSVYYETTFYSNSPNASWVNFKVSVQKTLLNSPYSWLNTPAKISFLLALTLAILAFLKVEFFKQTNAIKKDHFSISLNQFNRRLLAFVLVSLAIWLLLLAINSNPLANLENWYTDHARHTYVSSLFIKDGFSVFNQPLGTLSSLDNSHFMFVTWPEMPHLYPLGSIFLFLPFGTLLQNGFNATLIYKLEIGLFLVIAHVCLYLFLKVFLKKDMNLFLKLIGVYIIYDVLVVYAANGMFDSVAFIFSLFAIMMFVIERYDKFFMLTAGSIFFKYSASIFFLPLIIFSMLKILEKNRFKILQVYRGLIFSALLIIISGATAYSSLPFLTQTKPEFIMNGINAFQPHAQISWNLQAFSVILTLSATTVYTFYMLNKNNILSLSAILLLLPSFTLPYFQNWYFPFLFVYILIPQSRKESEATIIWLIFMVAVLSFGSAAFDPLKILDTFRGLLRI